MPFWLVLVAVVGVCFAAVLLWPRATTKPTAPKPLVAIQTAEKDGPARWGGERDVIALGDPDLERRRAIRDAQRNNYEEPQVFAGCNEARAAGRENIPFGDPAYRSDMDGDGDGLACEPIRH